MSADADGSVALLPLLLWMVVLLTAVLLEIGVLLVARAEAGRLADAAALAAVSAPDDPRAAARYVVAAGGGRLEACACPPGGAHAEVVVSVAVGSSPARALGPGRVEETAAAALVAEPATPHRPRAYPGRRAPAAGADR